MWTITWSACGKNIFQSPERSSEARTPAGKGTVRQINKDLVLINKLEINDEILYGRMENIERSTQVS